MGKKSKKNKRSKNSCSKLNGNTSAAAANGGGKRRSKRLNGQKKGSRSFDTVADDDELRQTVEEGGCRTIIEIPADGNCLFRSLSDQLYNDYGKVHYETVRSDVCDFIENNEDQFAVFLVLDESEEDEDAANFEEYCAGMREDGEWGGNVELVAAARLYRRNITVFSAAAAFTIEHGSDESSGPDMLLSYHDNDHYNSVRDNSETPTTRSDTRRCNRESGMQENQQRIGDTAASEDMDVDTPPDTGKPGKKSRNRGLKPNDFCNCGSGLRYKKCCLPAEKRKERLRKWKEKNGIDETEETEHPVEETLANGKLKVLSI